MSPARVARPAAEAPAPAAARPALLPVHVLSALVLALVLVLLALLSFLHKSRDQDAALARVRLLSQVRADVAQGALHLAFSDEPGSPWQREQGVALLRQAARVLDSQVPGDATPPPPSALGGPDADGLSRTAHSLAEAAQAAGPGGAPGGPSALDMRLQLGELERGLTQAMAAQMRRYDNLRTERRRLFLAVLGLASAALVGIAASGLWLLRRQARQRHAQDAEQALQRQELEARVAGRTAELEAALARQRADEAQLQQLNAELLVARDAAESANRAKSAFLASMGDAFRTPLNAIIGLNHLMQRDLGATVQGDRLDRIGQAARQLLALMNAVLDLSRIEAGRLEIRPQPFDPAALLQRTVDEFGTRSPVRGLRVAVSHGPLPRRARGDPERLQQALGHLLDHAVRVSGGAPVRLTVEALPEEPGGWLLRLEVADGGPELPPGLLARLFEPFPPVEAAAGARAGGLGIGLALVRRLAESMGGQAGAQGEPGRGNRYWFTVRLAPDEAAPPAPLAGQVLLAEAGPAGPAAPATVLSACGLQVQQVRSGEEAFDQAASGTRWSLIVVDLQLPGTDVLALVRCIRALPALAATPIVALAALPDVDTAARAAAAGIDALLPHPADRPAVQAVLRRWLSPPLETAAAAAAWPTIPA